MQKIDAYYLIIDYRITYLLFVNVDTFLQGGIPKPLKTPCMKVRHLANKTLSF